MPVESNSMIMNSMSPSDMVNNANTTDIPLSVSSNQKTINEESNMAEILNPSGMMMAGGGNDGLFGGGGGVIGGLLLGTLLRNNNGLLGGTDVVNGRIPSEQATANMSLMQSIGAVDKAVAVGTAAMEASQAAQSAAIVSQLNSVTSSLASRIDSTKETVNAMAMVLAQQLNSLEKTSMENRYLLAQDVNNDGDKTRALIVSQYEATLNRQLSDANAALAAARNENLINERSRGIEVTTTNNINQMQQQQQQQAQYGQLVNALWGLNQSIRSTNEAINVGSGTLTANPTNTNTNIR